MNPYPHELQLGDIYFSPWLPALSLAFLLALITALLLNRLKLSRFFYAHSYLFLAMMVLYLILIDRFFIRF
ncbi:DUF1656 domain-containing protein [Hydrogenimonas urashimensis]|uniref:DUF1656 domain-containing protein n=1 Tax=Hydrogenimonas urashimensis TaxID=2740515 RepID=UPI00191692E8|nr:DUF1656 domain-containing protein [Hydrogenimonas urashimensis]